MSPTTGKVPQSGTYTATARQFAGYSVPGDFRRPISMEPLRYWPPLQEKELVSMRSRNTAWSLLE